MSDLGQKILAASVALVEEKGVRAVSFREVARRAGVSHQTPYHHFGNHLGILRAIAADGFGQLADAMRGAADAAGPDALDALSAAGVAYVEFARTHVGHFRVMFQHDLVDVHDPAEPLAEAERTHATLVGLCAKAHAAGYGRALDAEQLTQMSWSLVHGVAVLLVEGVFARKADLDDAAERALTEQVVQGLDALLRK